MNRLTPSPSVARTSVGMAVASLGIVFGDIGTSPIDAFREAFDRSGSRPAGLIRRRDTARLLDQRPGRIRSGV